jgi:hypothetical protein
MSAAAQGASAHDGRSGQQQEGGGGALVAMLSATGKGQGEGQGEGGSEAINISLSRHQMQVQDWEYGPLTGGLHQLLPTLDAVFDLQLGGTLPKFEVCSDLRNAPSSYQAARDGSGMRDRIRLFTEFVRSCAADPAQHGNFFARVVLELLHCWEAHHGEPGGAHTYHSDGLRTKAEACGLIVPRKGSKLEYNERFRELLARCGITVAAYVAPPAPAPSRRSRRGGRTVTFRTPWVCGCPVDPTTVYAEAVVELECQRCHTLLVPG